MHPRQSQQLQVDAPKWQKELEMVTPKRRRFKSRQTWAPRHDAEGQCPECEALGPSPSSVRRRSRILNPKCGWTVERGQKALQKLLNQRELCRTARGYCLDPRVFQVESLFYAVIKLLSCRPLVEWISCWVAKESGQPRHTGI